MTGFLRFWGSNSDSHTYMERNKFIYISLAFKLLAFLLRQKFSVLHSTLQFYHLTSSSGLFFYFVTLYIQNKQKFGDTQKVPELRRFQEDIREDTYNPYQWLGVQIIFTLINKTDYYVNILFLSYYILLKEWYNKKWMTPFSSFLEEWPISWSVQWRIKTQYCI